ncbi:hypothetical protein [Photobacterium alginatilyticum]|uniref:DUF4034 domain-containing protein n=1 Tax=Photobacterium alginatilyticum TaxID=1775171 RepID=A0ABW9YK40_9GAMM|nr:hypothetical protein [Photobacterium alginatilyticum]NBI54177.1 hypothetical protein [Photobacterium alginatilyticum]
MKKITIAYIVVIQMLYSLPALGQLILPVNKACDEQFINDMVSLKTIKPSNYYYYHYIASGGCQGVELSEDRFDRINKHFAKLGNLDAKWALGEGYKELVKNARLGSIAAKGKIVQANTVQETPHFSRDKDLDALQLSDEIKQRYVSEILELAEKGDIRALRTALVYYLWTPLSLSGSDTDAIKATNRLKNAQRLVKRFGDQYGWLKMLYKIWLLEAKDVAWCTQSFEGKQYTSGFEKDLETFSRPLLCSSVFDKKLYEQIRLMDEVSRIRDFKEQLVSLDANFTGNMQARLKKLKEWDKAANHIALLAYFNVPLAKEMLAFMLTSLPYEPNQNLAGFYWIDLDHEPSPLMRLISSVNGKNGYNINKKITEQVIPEILASEKHFGMSYLYQGRLDDYYKFTLKNVLPKGDLPTLYSFYLMFKFEDNTRAWAMIKALEQYDTNMANQLAADFTVSGLHQPDRLAVEKVMAEIKPYLPERSKAHYSQIDWRRDIKPYLLLQLSLRIEQGISNNQRIE